MGDVLRNVSVMTIGAVQDAHELTDKQMDTVLEKIQEEHDNDHIFNVSGILDYATKTPNERFCDRAISDFRLDSGKLERACVDLMNVKDEMDHYVKHAHSGRNIP